MKIARIFGMLGLAGAIVVLAACASGGGAKSQQQDNTKPLTEVEKAYISRVELDGRLLYEKDVRAATATDLLISRIDPSDYENFLGWVTYAYADDYRVSFHEEVAGAIKVVADVDFDTNGRSKVSLSPAREMSTREISMVRARMAALRMGGNSCSENFNTVIIPSQNAGAWDVYILAATTNPDLVQIGGHVKVTVSKQTSEIIETTPLSKSCLSFDKAAKLPEGGTLAVMVATHIISPMPVAIHPYLNLLHDTDMVVGSERGTWLIESGKISLLK